MQPCHGSPLTPMLGFCFPLRLKQRRYTYMRTHACTCARAQGEEPGIHFSFPGPPRSACRCCDIIILWFYWIVFGSIWVKVTRFSLVWCRHDWTLTSFFFFDRADGFHAHSIYFFFSESIIKNCWAGRHMARASIGALFLWKQTSGWSIRRYRQRKCFHSPPCLFFHRSIQEK